MMPVKVPRHSNSTRPPGPSFMDTGRMRVFTVAAQLSGYEVDPLPIDAKHVEGSSLQHGEVQIEGPGGSAGDQTALDSERARKAALGWGREESLELEAVGHGANLQFPATRGLGVNGLGLECEAQAEDRPGGGGSSC